MKTPPFLMFAVLLFWGWQAEFLAVGALMGLVLEGARWIRTRWDLSDEDFSRVWTFCTLLFLAAAVYSFTDNGGPETFRGLFQTTSLSAQRSAGAASARTAAAIIRWLPMLFFLFVAAQAYSTREEIPFYTISLILQRRWRKAKKLGRTMPPGRGVNVAYPFFALCLFAASVHPGDNMTYFYGASMLVVWALWPYRSRRFGLLFWTIALSASITLGYFGQLSIGQLTRYASNLNTQWLVEFLRGNRGTDPTQSKTEIGQIGRIKTSMRIVIRLEPKKGNAPTYLREATYRLYKAGDRPAMWLAGQSKNDFDNVPPDKDGFTWTLVPRKTNSSEVNIACYLNNGSGLLPLPETSGQLRNLPAFIMKKNSAGAVLIDGPGLLIFDALYGPGQMIDSLPSDEDRLVAVKETPALDEVIAKLQLKGKSTNEVLHALSGFFQSEFKYRMWQDGAVVRTNETPLARFLLRTRAGHCEYFATSTVLLLRHLGIPARYAVGYMVHETSGHGYVVRDRDAHAWCMVWDEPGRQWVNFDTTPASWMEHEGRMSQLQEMWDAWSWLQFQISKLRWGQGHLREWLLIGIIPVLIILLYQIIRKRRRHRRKGADLARSFVWPGLDSEFYQIEKNLADRGCLRHSNEPLSDWLERAVASPALVNLREPLQGLLRLHYRYRFDPHGLSETDRDGLRREARDCLERLTMSPRDEAGKRN